MRHHSRIAIVTAGFCVTAMLAACGGGDERESGGAASSPTPVTPTTDAEPVDDEGRLGGSETGFTIDVGDDWIELDMDTGELVGGVDELGLNADEDFLRRTLEGLAAIPGVVFAVEAGAQLDVVDDFATNVNGHCHAVPVGLDLEQVMQASERDLQAVGAVNFASSATTAGNTEALRNTYELPTDLHLLLGVQYVFFNADDDLCTITFTTTELDDDLERFDRIADTLRLT